MFQIAFESYFFQTASKPNYISWNNLRIDYLRRKFYEITRNWCINLRLALNFGYYCSRITLFEAKGLKALSWCRPTFLKYRSVYCEELNWFQNHLFVSDSPCDRKSKLVSIYLWLNISWLKIEETYLINAAKALHLKLQNSSTFPHHFSQQNFEFKNPF